MSLWAITCLFNPAGYRVRGENYRIFRHHLKIPLVTVELAYEDDFTIQPGEADILVQRRGGARLWQKERLLNLALQALPDDCDAVIAIDADILVADARWPAMVRRALDDQPVIQPYSTMFQLDPNGRRVWSKASTISVWSRTGSRIDMMDRTGDEPKPFPGNGHVWAARRSFLDRHGFYDGCIVGGGDTAFMCAAAGAMEDVVGIHHMSSEQERRYLEWAEPVYAEAAGNVGFLPTEINHLWHGSPENRRWTERHAALREVGFDPYRDIEVNSEGIWEWASDRPDLHDFVRSYFVGRQEDEAATIPAPETDLARIVIVHAPPMTPHPYDVVLTWIQREHPDLAAFFDLAVFPTTPKTSQKLAVPWLQDPTEFIAPAQFQQAVEFERQCDELGLNIINRPSRQANAGKQEAQRRLCLAGLTTPRVAPVDLQSDSLTTLEMPYLVREDLGHGGEFRLIQTEEDAANMPRNIFAHPVASEFIDVSSEDGRFRKYRAVVVGDHVISHHLQVSESWRTHGKNRVNDLQTREEEIEYISKPDPFASEMLRVSAALELEFLGIDYSVDRQGNLIVWEANQFPHIHFSKFGLVYRNFAMDRTIAAMVLTYLQLASIDPPKKLLRQASYDG